MTLEIGLGLLSIGRRWGVNDVDPPSEEAAVELIQSALYSGIRWFDTAPAYGASEEILGIAKRRTPKLFKDVTIATKVGEHWQSSSHTTYVDHSYDKMMRSLDHSFTSLEVIDVLQLHKATVDNIVAPDTLKFFAEAEARGVQALGASVSDIETVDVALASGLYKYLQFPLNSEVTIFRDKIEQIMSSGVLPIINRPFAMGKHAIGKGAHAKISAFNYVKANVPDGVILTGTRSITHLRENLFAFSKF